MRALVPLIFAAFAALTFAFPTSLETRGKEVCDNAPKTVTGTTFHPRADDVVTWCAPNTQTYIKMKVIAVIWQEEAAMLKRMIAAMLLCYQILRGQLSDGVVLNGVYEYACPDLGLQYRFRNANNHQLTLGVINSALTALWDWMEHHEVATCTFDIFDGVNQVGTGEVVGV